jgi:hypothetical protein
MDAPLTFLLPQHDEQGRRGNIRFGSKAVIRVQAVSFTLRKLSKPLKRKQQFG